MPGRDHARIRRARYAHYRTTVLAAPRGSDFTPLDDPSTILWLDADSEVGYADTNAMTTLVDQTGTGNWTDATGCLYRTGVSGVPGACFGFVAASTHHMAGTVASGAKTVFFLVKSAAANNTSALLMSTNGKIRHQAAGLEYYRNEALATVSFGGTVTDLQVVTLVISGSGVGGVTWYLNAGSGTAFDPNDDILTGTNWQLSQSGAWEGYIKSLVVCSGALADTNRVAIRDYLMKAGGL